MLRVLIADDESKVCQLIEKLVDWDVLGMEVVAVAENGIEALEKIKEFHPDIVITDIRMPGYDGLDLIRLGKEEAPNTEFVIISGYRHFEYAQMAIRYGVNAYLLKPIRKDELTETLKRLSAHFKEQTEQLSLEEKRQRAIQSDEKNLRQAFLQDLVGRRNKEVLTQPLDRINREFHYHFEPGEFSIAILKLDGRVCDEEKNVRFMAEKVQAAAGKLLNGYVMEAELTELNGFHFFLLNYDLDDRMQIRRQMKALLSEIRVQGDILKNLAVTMALGEGVGRLSEIGISLKNARLLIEERLLGGTGKLMEGSIDSGESFADSEIFAKFNDRISHTLESLDPFALREELILREVEDINRVLQGKKLPDALFALNETAVGQCFKELFKGKKQGTEKILFMGMDAEKTAKLLEDEMLSVERDGRKQGKEAVKLLLEAFDTEENDRIRGKRVMIPYKVTGV